MDLKLPVKLHCDSKATIQIAAIPIYHENQTYRDKLSFLLRKNTARPHPNRIIEHISTDLQIADVLTKGLGKALHDFLLSKVRMFNLLTLHNLR